MAKTKSKGGVPNKHLHARISFLQQAATYLTIESQATGTRATFESGDYDRKHERQLQDQERVAQDITEAAKAGLAKQRNSKPIDVPPAGGLPLYLTSHLTQVARKSQIRLDTSIKHSICKRCSTVLVEGNTCRQFIENLSTGGKKPHANVLVKKCEVCSAQKRCPIGAQRQAKKGRRTASSKESEVS